MQGMDDAGRETALSDGKAAPGRPRPDVDAAMRDYLALTNGDVRQAFALAVTDAVEAAKLVSFGFARWRQPVKRTVWGS